MGTLIIIWMILGIIPLLEFLPLAQSILDKIAIGVICLTFGAVIPIAGFVINFIDYFLPNDWEQTLDENVEEDEL